MKIAREIWKYELDITDRQDVSMPKGAKVLAVQMQREAVTLWAEVDPQAKREPRHFRIFGTGHPMPLQTMGYEDVYIGTVQERSFVWHVYEQT